MEECLFRCIESALLVAAASGGSKGAVNADRKSHYHAFAVSVTGDLVQMLSDPLRLASLKLFIRHCQLNLPNLAPAADADGAERSLGTTELMTCGLLRVVLALEQQHELTELWLLLQPHGDGDGADDFALQKNRAPRPIRLVPTPLLASAGGTSPLASADSPPLIGNPAPPLASGDGCPPPDWLPSAQIWQVRCVPSSASACSTLGLTPSSSAFTPSSPTVCSRGRPSATC